MSIISRPGYVAVPLPVGMIALLFAQQALASILFAGWSTAMFIGGPLFDLGTFGFLFEDYWIFLGRWTESTLPAAGTRALGSNVASAVLITLAVILSGGRTE